MTHARIGQFATVAYPELSPGFAMKKRAGGCPGITVRVNRGELKRRQTAIQKNS